MLKSRLLTLCALVVVMLSGCISLRQPFDRGRLHLEIIDKADRWYTSDQILLIPLEGIVTEGSMRSFTGQTGMLVELKDRLDAARKNKAIKAVVLRINSPGGTVTASELIHHEIMEFKKETKLPVIAMLGDIAASGGFYIATAADEIYALPTTVTGSIGVIIELPGVKKLSEKIGVEMRTIKSGPVKDIGSIWTEMTPQEREIFQTIINNYYGMFLERIGQGRGKHGMSDQQLRALADGRVFTPEIAMKAHLIDGVKYPDEVLEIAKKKADLRDAMIVSYEYPDNYRGNIHAATATPSPRAGGDVNLINIDLGQLGTPTPQFLYMWKP